MGIAGLKMPELLIILLIIVVIFGAGKLANVGGALGKSIREFRKASEGLDEEPVKKDKEAEKETTSAHKE